MSDPAEPVKNDEFKVAPQSSESGPERPRKRRKQEYKLHYMRYIWAYFYIFYVSYGIPMLIGSLYMFFLALPAMGIHLSMQSQPTPQIIVVVDPGSLLTQEGGLIALFTQPGPSTYYFLTLPLVYVGLYLLHLYLTAVAGRQILRSLERRVPAEEGIIERRFVDPDPVEFRKLVYYHSRNFVLRVIKWKFTKGMFPWLQNWAFNFIGEHVGKGVVFEPEFYASELATYEDGVYIGPGALASSHVVEGVWGRVVILPVLMKKRSCACGKNIIGCGTVMDERSVLLPEGALAKAFHLRANEWYDGVPAVRILPKKLQRDYFPGIKLPEIPDAVLKEWGIEKKRPAAEKEKSPETSTKNTGE
jgi:hypothetical protein